MSATATLHTARRRIARARERDWSEAKPIVLLGCVLALDGADLGTVGAVASQLARQLRITNTEIGLLASVVSLAAAVATIPIGALSDRVPRVRLLAGSIALWSVAMVVAGAAGSYGMLLLARLFLGTVQATSGPTLASLTGDLFPAQERGRITGYILSGELVGGGVGFLISGVVAALLSWRFAFWMLAVPGIVLAVVLWLALPEPARGTQSRLAAGKEAGNTQRRNPEASARMSIGRAIRYVASIPTNVYVMVASALGYFFFGGVRTFALIFVRGHYDLGQAAATATLGGVGLGALVGILLGGRIADRMLRGGRIEARLLVAGVSYLLAAALFVAPILTDELWLALPLFVLAAAALTAPNPPLDAARLDVMPAPMWGRAEGVRTVTRTLAVGAAPLLFGWVADQIARPSPHDLHAIGATAANGHALELTFLIMLVPVAGSGLVLLRGKRHYEDDLERAAEDQKRWSAKR